MIRHANTQSGSPISVKLPSFTWKFLFISILTAFALSAPQCISAIGVLANFTAAAVKFILPWENVRRMAATLSSKTFGETIATGCVGTIFFSMAAAAFGCAQGSICGRIAGFAFLSLCIFVANIVRIAVLLEIGTHWPNGFDYAHRCLWAILLVYGTLLSAVLFMSVVRSYPLNISLRFIGRVGLIFILATFSANIILTPTSYYFGKLGTLLFHRSEGFREITFQSEGPDTHVEIINRNLIDHDGSGPVRTIDIPTIPFVVGPTVLLASLIFASTGTVERKLKYCFTGSAISQLFLFLIIGFAILVASSDVGLASFSPSRKAYLNELTAWAMDLLQIVIPLITWLFYIQKIPASNSVLTRAA